MKIEILSSRKYGEPKLSKPKELQGYKQAGSARFGPKCKCPVFVKEDYVYVKHRDWFSPSISIPEALKAGIIEKRNKKFIYNDNFGSVVLRSEAWLKIQIQPRFFGAFDPRVVNRLIGETELVAGLREFELMNHDWVQFYEDIIAIAYLDFTQ